MPVDIGSALGAIMKRKKTIDSVMDQFESDTKKSSAPAVAAPAAHKMTPAEFQKLQAETLKKYSK